MFFSCTIANGSTFNRGTLKGASSASHRYRYERYRSLCYVLNITAHKLNTVLISVISMYSYYTVSNHYTHTRSARRRQSLISKDVVTVNTFFRNAKFQATVTCCFLPTLWRSKEAVTNTKKQRFAEMIIQLRRLNKLIFL